MVDFKPVSDWEDLEDPATAEFRFERMPHLGPIRVTRVGYRVVRMNNVAGSQIYEFRVKVRGRAGEQVFDGIYSSMDDFARGRYGGDEYRLPGDLQVIVGDAADGGYDFDEAWHEKSKAFGEEGLHFESRDDALEYFKAVEEVNKKAKKCIGNLDRDEFDLIEYDIDDNAYTAKMLKKAAKKPGKKAAKKSGKKSGRAKAATQVETNKIYWKDVIGTPIGQRKEILLSGPKGSRSYKYGGKTVFWGGRESVTAQRELDDAVRRQAELKRAHVAPAKPAAKKAAKRAGKKRTTKASPVDDDEDLLGPIYGKPVNVGGYEDDENLIEDENPYVHEGDANIYFENGKYHVTQDHLVGGEVAFEEENGLYKTLKEARKVADELVDECGGSVNELFRK